VVQTQKPLLMFKELAAAASERPWAPDGLESPTEARIPRTVVPSSFSRSQKVRRVPAPARSGMRTFWRSLSTPPADMTWW